MQFSSKIAYCQDFEGGKVVLGKALLAHLRNDPAAPVTQQELRELAWQLGQIEDRDLYKHRNLPKVSPKDSNEMVRLSALAAIGNALYFWGRNMLAEDPNRPSTFEQVLKVTKQRIDWGHLGQDAEGIDFQIS